MGNGSDTSPPALARAEGNELLIEDRRLRRLTAAIVAVMLGAFVTVILLTVLGDALDGFVGSVPVAWIAGPALWVLSILLCEVYIRGSRGSADAGGYVAAANGGLTNG